MIDMLKRVLRDMELKFTIRENSNKQYISLTFEKEDLFDQIFRYNVLIILDESVRTVSIYVPSINPVGGIDVKNIKSDILHEKIAYMNERTLYGYLNVRENNEVRYKYSFVYIDDYVYTRHILDTLFDYIDFITYEAGLIINPVITLKDLKRLREI